LRKSFLWGRSLRGKKLGKKRGPENRCPREKSSKSEPQGKLVEGKGEIQFRPNVKLEPSTQAGRGPEGGGRRKKKKKSRVFVQKSDDNESPLEWRHRRESKPKSPFSAWEKKKILPIWALLWTGNEFFCEGGFLRREKKKKLKWNLLNA